MYWTVEEERNSMLLIVNLLPFANTYHLFRLRFFFLFCYMAWYVKSLNMCLPKVLSGGIYALFVSLTSFNAILLSSSCYWTAAQLIHFMVSVCKFLTLISLLVDTMIGNGCWHTFSFYEVWIGYACGDDLNLASMHITLLSWKPCLLGRQWDKFSSDFEFIKAKSIL